MIAGRRKHEIAPRRCDLQLKALREMRQTPQDSNSGKRNKGKKGWAWL
jgi:hypothetical protein